MKFKLEIKTIFTSFGRNLLTKSRNARFTAPPSGHFRFRRLTITSHKTNFIIAQLLQIVSPRPFYYVTFLIKLSWQLITSLFLWIISPIQILMHLSFASLGNPRELKGNGTVLVYFSFLVFFFSNLDITLWVFKLSRGEELFVINLIAFTQGL